MRPMPVYAIKEIFYTLQGEGYHAGRPAVFCRFAGCNLWSGREVDRSTAQCTFCDTDFVGTDGLNGGKYGEVTTLVDAIARLWPASEMDNRLVVFTGGEPLLQLDASLVRGVQSAGFQCAVETNGTLTPPSGIDWITVSPKGSAPLRLTRAHEVKLVFPQPNARPDQFDHLQADHYFLQPMDGADATKNTRSAIEYCMLHPRWRLSLQTHKYLGIP